MTLSQNTETVALAFNHSLLGNTTSQNSTSDNDDICAGAGTYSDGTCRTIWPFWVEVSVPLCCVLFFLLTLTVVYLRPFGSTSDNDSSKQRLNSDESERTDRDQGVSYKQTDTKV